MKENSRRDFLKAGGLTLAALALNPTRIFASPRARQPHTTPFPMKPAQGDYTSLRPAPEKRGFTSEAVERCTWETAPKIKDEKLRWMFQNCFPNTLDTTVRHTMRGGRPDTFVITGDIDAMWLRDSSAQVWPYLPLMKLSLIHI